MMTPPLEGCPHAPWPLHMAREGRHKTPGALPDFIWTTLAINFAQIVQLAQVALKILHHITKAVAVDPTNLCTGVPVFSLIVWQHWQSSSKLATRLAIPLGRVIVRGFKKNNNVPLVNDIFRAEL